ncbi:ABC transporter ATP-binding protein [bacterium]|nr:ABC transporter ATP-binding protein [candidate division CSSED10-310 bacterium]
MELTIEHLSKTYPGGVQALQDVSLTVRSGMFGLLGPNGAGKSTLMRIIATLQEPDSGTIMLNGLDVLKEKHAVRKLLGYLPQEFGLDPKVTAEDLLDHLAVLKGIASRNRRREHVDHLLAKANLTAHRKKRLGVYSGGMKQRFGIAQALLGDPRLLIVDEPTAGLDPEERIRFHNILSEIGENIVVILSTHIVADVSDVCRNMAIIHKGQLLLNRNPLDAIQTMAGNVWRRIVDRQAMPLLENRHIVISSRLFGGRIKVRIYCESDPGDGFQPAEPDLEDVYFMTIRHHDAEFAGRHVFASGG